MLGVGVAYQGEGLGKHLFLDTYHRVKRAAETTGAPTLVVDSLNGRIAEFYSRLGLGGPRKRQTVCEVLGRCLFAHGSCKKIRMLNPVKTEP